MLMNRALAAGDIELPLPPALRQCGDKALARIDGNPDGYPVIVLGGISANRFVSGEENWWPGLVGAGRAIDPARHRIVGLDFAADESGAFAPSTRDQASLLIQALDTAGIEEQAAVVGASYGGMIALNLAQYWPERVSRIVVISAPAKPHAAATAVREIQRRIVALGLESGRGEEALGIARGLAMLTYRSPEEFEQRFAGGLSGDDPLGPSEPGAYLRSRGKAYRSVMSPGRFISLSGSLDRHEIDPSAIRAPVLAIGATSDQIIFPEQMKALAEALPDARLHMLDCLYGHDMFLKEAEKIGPLIRDFLEDL